MPQLDAAEPSDKGERHSGTDVEFRTLTHNHKRRAFKLERMFWQILEGAAAARRLSLASFVAEIIDGKETLPNKTSLLRVTAAQWLIDRAVDVSNRSLSQKMLGQIIKACPVPCFIVNRDNAIESPNGAFMRLLDTFRGERDLPSSGSISLRFRSDVPSLAGRCMASSSGFVLDKLVLGIGSQTMVLDAQITALQSSTARPLGFLVYILPRERASEDS